MSRSNWRMWAEHDTRDLAIPDLNPTARDLMERALDPHILVGMPHLNAHGLSETWLMKELGHRHWLMLARDMGMENADFRTSDGSAAYAAICATSLQNGRLDLVSSNDVLSIRSSLMAVTLTQTSSRHRLYVGASAIADVELLSTFVHRSSPGDNHSIARVALSSSAPRTYADNELARSAAGMRASFRDPRCGFPGRSLIGSVWFQTSPSQEFNGAGLFYFAEFQALMDRASELRGLPNNNRNNVSGRDVFFFGNVKEGGNVNIETYSATDERCLEFCVSREDRKIIAYALSS